MIKPRDRTPVLVRALAIILVNAAFLTGCDEGSGDQAVTPEPVPEAVPEPEIVPEPEPEPEPVPEPEPGARIVSLSPALTQILIDLGQRDAIVGRTQYAPPGLESVPIVGDLLTTDLERITAVSPNLLLVQPSAGGVDPDLLRFARGRGLLVAGWHIDRLADVERVVTELPDVLARVEGDALHARSAGSVWRSRLRVELLPSRGISNAGRVVILYAVDPPAAFGRETYIDDVFTALGGSNAIRRPGYPVLSLEDLLVLSPDAILVLAPDGKSAAADVASLRARLGANAEGMRLIPLDGSDLLIPGTRLLQGVDTMKSAFSRKER